MGTWNAGFAVDSKVSVRSLAQHPPILHYTVVVAERPAFHVPMQPTRSQLLEYLAPINSLSGSVWPAVPTTRASRQLALLLQFEHSQWWPSERLAEQQRRQLAALAIHAVTTVPFYRERLASLEFTSWNSVDEDSWRCLPLLTRAEVQQAGDTLDSNSISRDHGRVTPVQTSGSTGQPVRIKSTELPMLYWHTLTVRDHLWHGRDFSQKLAVIRDRPLKDALPPDGVVRNDWGPSTRDLVRTGPSAVLNIHSTIEAQAGWLRRQNPGYVLGYPSALRAITEHLAASAGLTQLVEVRTFGEILEPMCREAIQSTWGVPVVDAYSSNEVGYIALQCPEHEHYHVQSESVYMEVLDERGRPCLPGQVGQVVVTPLHNYATPLIRYAIGDYAEVGEPCPCGRGLPVLKRILGRQRNVLRLPDGTRRWVTLNVDADLTQLPRFQQFQIVQTALDHIEARIVRPIPFSADEEAVLRRYFCDALGYPFEVSVKYVTEIERSPSGKFEDFRCEISQS